MLSLCLHEINLNLCFVFKLLFLSDIEEFKGNNNCIVIGSIT